MVELTSMKELVGSLWVLFLLIAAVALIFMYIGIQELSSHGGFESTILIFIMSVVLMVSAGKFIPITQESHTVQTQINYIEGKGLDKAEFKVDGETKVINTYRYNNNMLAVISGHDVEMTYYHIYNLYELLWTPKNIEWEIETIKLIE